LGHSNGSFWTREFHGGERRKKGRKRKKKNTNQKERKNLSLEREKTTHNTTPSSVGHYDSH